MSETLSPYRHAVTFPSVPTISLVVRVLTQGPEEAHTNSLQYNDNFSLQAIVEFKIAHAVPINGTATYHDIASAVKLPEVKVRQLVRHAMTNRIFYEPSPGIVAHTAASRTLRNEEVLSTWIALCSGEFFPAAARGVDALQKLPDSQEPSEAGWAFGHNCVGTPMFKVAMSDPARAKRFGVGMASLAGGPGYELAYTAQCYDWAALGEATVVDLGGSHGFLSVDLAKRFPDLKFVVQDLPKAIDSVDPETIPADVRDRVDFMAHDFYTPQPVKDADAYVYRWIMHNNSDKYAVKMLRALIPALKPGARVIINDLCLVPPGHEDDWDNRITRNMDLTMLKLLNAREREDHDWQDLFRQADARFKYKGHKTLPGYRMAVMEAVWEP